MSTSQNLECKKELYRIVYDKSGKKHDFKKKTMDGTLCDLCQKYLDGEYVRMTKKYEPNEPLFEYENEHLLKMHQFLEHSKYFGKSRRLETAVGFVLPSDKIDETLGSSEEEGEEGT